MTSVRTSRVSGYLSYLTLMAVLIHGNSAKNSTCLKFGAVLFPPHTVVSKDPAKPVTGWMVDFAVIIAAKLGVCYDIIKLHSYGIKLPNGTYTGGAGMLNRNEIDMMLSPLTMSPFREEAYDFSTYVFFDQQEIIAKIPKPEADITGFVKPFPNYLWGLLFAVILFTAAILVMIQVFNADSMREHLSSNHSIKAADDEMQKHQQRIGRSLIWLIAALLAQSMPWEPKAMSVKVITGIWLLFCLIIGTLYRSNLKAMLILPKIHLPFTNLEELVEAGLTTYVLEGSFLANAVLDAPGNSTLGRFRKQTLINDNVEENIREMFRGRIVGFGSYSALIGLINQDFAKTGQCNTFMAKEAYFKGTVNAVPFPPGSKLLPKINKMIYGLREFGILEYLHKKSVQNATRCRKTVTTSVSTDYLRPLEMKDFYGVFSIYLGGLAIGLFVFLAEILIK